MRSRSGQHRPRPKHVRGHSKRVCRKEATKMMKRGKEELPWWPPTPRLPFLFHSFIPTLCFFSHPSLWAFVSSNDLTAGCGLCDLYGGQLAATAAEGSVCGLGSNLGQHQVTSWSTSVVCSRPWSHWGDSVGQCVLHQRTCLVFQLVTTSPLVFLFKLRSIRCCVYVICRMLWFSFWSDLIGFALTV